MSFIATATSSFTSSPTPPPATVASTAATDGPVMLALIMSVMVTSICFVAFLWQCIQCYVCFRKLNWSQVIVILMCQCVLGGVFSALCLAEYLLSISCEFRAVAELIAINIGDFLLQALLLHRVYAIKRSKWVLITGISLLASIIIYIMISLAAGQLVAIPVNAFVCVTQSRAWVIYGKAILDITFYLAAYVMFILQAYRQKICLELSLKQALLHNGLLYCLLASGYGCIMSYFILKHIVIICAQKPHGNRTTTLYPSGKDNTADTLSLNLTRLVELPAPERRDSGMIRY
ncbi:hypothetical protein K450DRAFT_195142 [Umbelopsis ramanniana AG]|uniref:Uncharacterized protein n=1 Tax=Umbelopsis ramanniana AG TaxID=1314678 RepID=A0AAD5EJ90_UMBRA|nr:uncharacterized protein K450DRAFT_195142 [Umbelopsis ramanniana AG]KAI8584738.1 hypothetical protein K450DRAFT_195142 [Umbelopsis ramanniana AG]